MPNLAQSCLTNRDSDPTTCQIGQVSILRGDIRPLRGSRARAADVPTWSETRLKIDLENLISNNAYCTPPSVTQTRNRQAGNAHARPRCVSSTTLAPGLAPTPNSRTVRRQWCPMEPPVTEAGAYPLLAPLWGTLVRTARRTRAPPRHPPK